MKLLIPVFSPATGTWGGLTRVVAVARAAEAAGCQVAFCASDSLETSLRRHGYTVYSMPAATFLGLPASLSRIVEQRSQRATLPVRPGSDFGTIWLVLLISGMAKARYLKRLVAAELAAARDFGAEFVFTDLDLGAFLTAQIAGVPIAAAYQSPMAQGVGTLPWKLLNRAIGSVQKTYRLLLWVYDRTRSLPVVMLMAASPVTFWTSLTPMDLSRTALAVFYLALAAVWCAVAAVVALTNHGRLTRQPSLRERVA